MARFRTILCSIAVAACSNSPFAHQLGDGGADAPVVRDSRAIDTPLDAPSPGAVTIAVTLQGQPASGATVYFQNADSSLVAEMQTGSDGWATQDMLPGGFVTLIEPQPVVTGAALGTAGVPAGQVIDTFAGVKPGDVLVVAVGEEVAQAITFPIT